MLFKVTFDKEIHILKSGNATTLQELKSLIPKVFKIYPENFYLTYIDEDGDEITLGTSEDYAILLGSEAKSAKIMIREKSQDFYDETQQIQIEEEPQSPQEIEALLEKESEVNEPSQIFSNVPQDKILDESIEEKLKAILPTIISQIKTEVREEVINQSKILEQSKKEESKVIHENYICDGCGMRYITGIRYKCSVCNDFDFCEKCEASGTHPHAFLKIRHPSQAPLKIFVIMNDEEDSFEINGQRQPLTGLSDLFENGLNMAQQFLNPNGQRFDFRRPQQPEKKEVPVKEEKKEVPQKVEKKEAPKKEEKKEEKISPKVETKPKEETKSVQSSVKSQESKAIKKEKEQQCIENASYLTDVLNIKFTKAYKFSEKNHGLTKEELLELYFINHRC